MRVRRPLCRAARSLPLPTIMPPCEEQQQFGGGPRSVRWVEKLQPSLIGSARKAVAMSGDERLDNRAPKSRRGRR